MYAMRLNQVDLVMPIFKPKPESIAVEYDSRGQRVQRVFNDHFEARRFYVAKDKAGKHPKVVRVTSN